MSHVKNVFFSLFILTYTRDFISLTLGTSFCGVSTQLSDLAHGKQNAVASYIGKWSLSSLNCISLDSFDVHV